MTLAYSDFLARKLAVSEPCGFEPSGLGPYLFAFQRDLAAWALRRGRAALFCSTGLGKTRMQLEWAREVADQTDRPVIVLTPLAVAAQTRAEGRAIGLDVTLVRESADVKPGLNVCNYERLHKLNPSVFGGVVLDESSCIKNYNAKTLAQLMEAFGRTPFRLCATATPAPNDFTELGTHAEFLGVASRVEMLSEFFVHDGGDTQTWRLKKHARRAFWRWVASWGALVRTPSDIGHDDGAFALPPLETVHHVLRVDDADVYAGGELFPRHALSLTERRDVRRATIGPRVEACAKLVKSDRQPWVVWCDLNAEQDALESALGNECLSVYGALDIDEKERRLEAFVAGERRVLLGKPSIFGFGLNLQRCARMAFVGLSDSWESWHQAVRRCWRFGQKRPVQVHVFISELEETVLRNVLRKGEDAEAMAKELSAETAATVREAIHAGPRLRTTGDHNRRLALPSWLQTRGA